MSRCAKEWVLVTGGSGFVGAALVKRLLTVGCNVRAISRSPPKVSQTDLRKNGDHENQLEWFRGDITCLSSIRDAFIGAKSVFHVAALVNSAASREQINLNNVMGTENVSELSLESGVAKLIYVSTSDVFGLPALEETITERTPFRAWNEPYADSKIRASEVVKAYRSKGLVSSIIYPGWVYGPGDRAFFPMLLRQLQKGFMPLWAPKGFEIHLVYIEDLIDALLQAALCTAADNEDFLILDDVSGVEMDDLCRELASFFEFDYRPVRVPYRLVYLVAWLSQGLAQVGFTKAPLLTTNDVKSFGYLFRFSTEKARNSLGWVPRTPFRVGIQEALAWQKQQSLTMLG